MKRYERHGLLAVDPRAFMTLVAAEKPDRSNTRIGAVSVVQIRGPLDHHAQPGCELDNYDDIACRVDDACASDAQIVVLKVDSPGGAVSGCFELARAIRSKCAAAGKRLVAYVDGHACSAAYALASAAPEIVLPEAGIVGSVGVIDARVDTTAMDAAMGLRFAIVASGARKADGNPHLPLSQDELDEKQQLVDSLAGVFFALVADHRGKPAEKFAALQARMLHGAAAVQAGLADRVQSFDQMLASFAGARGDVMATKYEEARAALEESAKGDGDEAARARKALAAMDEPAEDAEGDAPPSDDEPAEDAEGDDQPSDDEKKKKETAAAAAAAASATVSAAAATKLAAQVESLTRENRKLKTGLAADERKALLASRPDLSADLVKTLSTLPLADAKAIVANIPAKPKAPKLAATATVPATRGEGQASPAPGDSALTRLSPQAKAMDVAMGLADAEGGVTRSATLVTFSVAGSKKAGAK